MKRIRLLLMILLPLFLLPACGTGNTQNDWKVYHAKPGSPVNPNFSAYSFEYPSTWKMEQEANHFTFVPDAKLFRDVPEKLNSGQIIAGLSMNVDISPEQMIDGYTSTLGDKIQFTEIVSIVVNGHPAAYREGKNLQTGDQVFVIATDIGENTRGLLTARVAEGELEAWKEDLFRIAQSLQLEK